MAAFLGIDYGSSMIKAAVTESSAQQPTLLMLAAEDPFVPACAMTRPGSNEIVVGDEAFRNRRRAGAQAVFPLGEAAMNADSSLSMHGKRVHGVEIHRNLLTQVKSVLAASPSPIPVSTSALTIPDTWPKAHFGLGAAARSANLPSPLLVREWQTALVMSDIPSLVEVLVVSAGFETCRATLCRLEGDRWIAARSTTIGNLSGCGLRRQLVTRFAESVIKLVRKDPRESLEADQQLHDAVEQLMRQLQRQSTASTQLAVFGAHLPLSLTRNEVANLLPKPQEFVTTAIDALQIRRSKEYPMGAIVWGELARLVPIDTWLTAEGIATKMAPLDVLAAGAARLAALTAEHRELLGGRAAWLTPTHGNSDGIDLLEMIPAAFVGASYLGEICITLNDSSHEQVTRTIRDFPFRFGRQRTSDWVLPDDRYAMVSNAHAALLRKGKEIHIRDLDSANGTYVNDLRIQEHSLKDGDVFRFGRNGPTFVVTFRDTL